jgi:MFS family permease
VARGRETGFVAELVPLRRNRDFLLLWSSQVVSTLGTRVTSVAFPLLVLAITDSPATAGVVGFFQTLPFLVCFLPAGAIVDRGDRKRLMLVADAVRAGAMASVVVAIAADHLTVAHLAAVAFVEGTFFVFFDLAESAALPHLVPSVQLPTAIAQNQARQQGADLVGQPLGGVLFGVGHAAPFLVDALSYAVSFVALLFVRPVFQEARERTATNLRRDIVEGVKWLWEQRFLRVLVLVIAGWNFVSNALVLALIVRAEELGASPALVGVMLAFFGGGAIVGALIAPAIQRRVSSRTVIVGATWISAAAAFLLVPMRWPLALGAVVGIAAVVGPVFNVVIATYRYALTPDRLQGRVVSAARVVAWGAIPLGTLSAGFLLEGIGATATLALLAVGMAVVALAATLLPSVRRVPAVAGLR